MAVPDVMPTLIGRFCERMNLALSQGAATGEMARAIAAELIGGGGKPDGDALVDALAEAFARALDPVHFFHERVLAPDERFTQCHELLKSIFDEAERDPLDRFLFMLRALADPSNDHPLVMLGRFWRVSGTQAYGAAGELRRFDYDPLTVTESIASLVSGNYMSLERFGRPGESIGAIGHLATRERFRHGQGHGTATLRAFEAEMQRIAQSRGEQLRLIVLEAQTDSQGFWYKLGYRWTMGVEYAQPPLEFDPATGERYHDEVPETLMVKLPGQPDAPTIRADLLADAVRAMYQNWSLEKTSQYAPAAAQRAREYVLGKVFQAFHASLPAAGADVPLGRPPALTAQP